MDFGIDSSDNDDENPVVDVLLLPPTRSDSFKTDSNSTLTTAGSLSFKKSSSMFSLVVILFVVVIAFDISIAAAGAASPSGPTDVARFVLAATTSTTRVAVGLVAVVITVILS